MIAWTLLSYCLAALCVWGGSLTSYTLARAYHFGRRLMAYRRATPAIQTGMASATKHFWADFSRVASRVKQCGSDTGRNGGDSSGNRPGASGDASGNDAAIRPRRASHRAGFRSLAFSSFSCDGCAWCRCCCRRRCTRDGCCRCCSGGSMMRDWRARPG